MAVRKVRGAYALSRHVDAPPTETGYGCQGMGILDVYMGPMTVVVPSRYATAEHRRIVESVAGVCAEPKTHGFDTKVYVQYSVRTDRAIAISDLADRNMILIGCEGNNRLIEELKGRLNLYFGEDGCEFRSHGVRGRYCLLYAQEMSIGRIALLIYANEAPLLARNLFTRSMILPSYSSGLDPYLNRQFLAFDGKRYVVA